MQFSFCRAGSRSALRSCREPFFLTATVASWIIAIVLGGAASPAAAQWTRVPEVPASNVFSLFANGDTIVAGTNNQVYISTNAGSTWQPSPRLALLLSNVTSLLGTKAVAFKFTPVGAGAAFQVDDVYLDPWKCT